jgi:hypothetical protein
MQNGICTRIRSLAMSVWLLMAIFATSCASSEAAGDRFYSAVVVGGGGSGHLSAIVYHPGYASERLPGSPGAGATGYVAAGRLTLDDGSVVELVGTGASDGSFTIGDDAYRAEGTTAGVEVMGTVDTPAGSSTFRGYDVAKEDATALCGTYDGISSGTWSFVIGPDGSLSGVFSSGLLSGEVVGSVVRIRWTGTGLAAGYSGTAEGTLTADGLSVAGSWSGTGGGLSGGGMFTSDGRDCAGAGAMGVPSPERSELPSSPECACRVDPVPVGGACCCDVGGPCFCCDSISFR